MAKILVCGFLGYEGYPLTLRLLRDGHEVYGIDNNVRNGWVKEVGSDSAIPLDIAEKRISYLKEIGKFIGTGFNLGDSILGTVFENFKPDYIFHLAAQPSAPFSNQNEQYSKYTIDNNLESTLNLIHIIKDYCPNCRLFFVSTMGEYGSTGLPISQGFLDCQFMSRVGSTHGMYNIDPDKWKIPYPRDPSSWYHLSKVMCTQAIYLAHKLWGLKATVFMQGVVYGIKTKDMKQNEWTRFDFDKYFGTVLNRFVAQTLINKPMTIYGKGGQTRGLLSLNDCIDGMTAYLDNPDLLEDFQVVNQLSHIKTISDIAQTVKDVADWDCDFSPEIIHIKNPRKESEYHLYEVEYLNLEDIGLIQFQTFEEDIEEMIAGLKPYRYRIYKYEDAM